MSDPQLTIMQKFKALSAGNRTAIIGGSVVIVLFTLGTIFTDDSTTPKTAKPASQKEGLNFFNAGNTNATEAVAASLETANQRILDQEKKITLLQETTKQAQVQGQNVDSHWSEISNLVAQVQTLQERMNNLGEKGGANAPTTKDKNLLDKLLPSGNDSNKPANGSTTTTANFGTNIGEATPSAVNPSPSAPVTTIQVVGEEKKIGKALAKKESPQAYIPSGSNFEAVLLNGMDASTAINANRSPTPALLRIKTDAILPNLFNFNVRECFVMVGGFGNMSTERVEMRTENMSCVAENGEVYEGKIEGYLVGEDGKAGARGRVVSKQGALLAKSFMAGFVGGLGSSFMPQSVQALNLGATNGSAPAYQYPSADQVLGSGISTGLSKSSLALSNFYIKLAEQMFPVVELDAGRKMTIILLKGVDLKMEKKG